MDVCESEQALRKHKTRRQPLVPTKKNNAITTTRQPECQTLLFWELMCVHCARLMLLVESGRIVCEAKLVDDIFQVLRPYKVVPAIALDKTGLAAVGVRFQSLSNLGSRLPSPSKTSVMSSCSSRGVSPSQSRPSIPPRRASPSRMRPSNSSNQSNNAFSVLNKMLALHIEKLCLIVYATLS